MAALDLATFLKEVKSANPTLQSAKLRAEALEHRIQPPSTLEDPFFAAGLDQIPTSGAGTSMLRLQLSQTVPISGKLSAKGEAAEARARVGSADAETTEREVVIVATQAFYRAAYNARARELNETHRKLLEDIVASTKARYKTGDSSHHDWLLARVELSVLDVDRLRLNREKKTLDALLNELRNQPPETPLELSQLEFADPPDAASPKEPLSAQPELKSLGALAEASDWDRKYAVRSYFPDLVIQGMYMKPQGMGMTGQASSWGFMVGINLPLFFYRKQSEVSAAAAKEQEAVLADRRGIENRLRTELVGAREELRTARDVVSLYKKDVIPTTVIAAKNAQTAYAAKRLPLSEFIETLRVQRAQELELLAAQIDVELAKTRERELLSAPPVMRLAPARPSLFGAGGMNAGMPMGSSGTVSMGKGMSGPTRKESGTVPGDSGTPMSGMGGMR